MQILSNQPNLRSSRVLKTQYEPIFNPFALSLSKGERIKNIAENGDPASAYAAQGQGQISPFVVSKIFARRPKGVGKKQGLWLLLGARLMALIPPLLLFMPLIYMTKKAIS
jgi:hypothetical protein